MIYLKASCAADPPRIWWCATGSLAFLPIHAAGIYGDATPGSSISDYVVSSYTPTLNALIHNSMSHQTRKILRGLLAVSQPNTPGLLALPHSTVELTCILQRAHHFDVHELEGPAAFVRNVVKGMESNSWVHLACHAIQDAVDPTKSALHLHDKNLELLAILTKQFPHAELAFLSASQTTTSYKELGNEAFPLVAGLMLAGY